MHSVPPTLISELAYSMDPVQKVVHRLNGIFVDAFVDTNLSRRVIGPLQREPSPSRRPKYGTYHHGNLRISGSDAQQG